jgi:hypothetical protein
LSNETQFRVNEELLNEFRKSTQIEIYMIDNLHSCVYVFLKADNDKLYRIETVYGEIFDEVVSSLDIFEGWIPFELEIEGDVTTLTTGKEYFDFHGTQGLKVYRRLCNFRIEIRTLDWDGTPVDNSVVFKDVHSTIYVSEFAHLMMITDEPDAIAEIEKRKEIPINWSA